MEVNDHPSKRLKGQPGNREELKRFLETYENEDTIVQNLWDTAKAVLRGEYIARPASVPKLERTQCKS